MRRCRRRRGGRRGAAGLSGAAAKVATSSFEQKSSQIERRATTSERPPIHTSTGNCSFDQSIVAQRVQQVCDGSKQRCLQRASPEDMLVIGNGGPAVRTLASEVLARSSVLPGLAPTHLMENQGVLRHHVQVRQSSHMLRLHEQSQILVLTPIISDPLTGYKLKCRAKMVTQLAQSDLTQMAFSPIVHHKRAW
eukprot:6472888-Amphidinium_carterae.1